jgi:carboxypeptidase C (cathepsin A)
MARIGAESTWQITNDQVFNNFINGGDWMMVRPDVALNKVDAERLHATCQNQRPNLEKVINSGIRVFIYDGDADYICNYMGVEAMARFEVQFTRKSVRMLTFAHRPLFIP